jgi:hypothetical protein
MWPGSVARAWLEDDLNLQASLFPLHTGLLVKQF